MDEAAVKKTVCDLVEVIVSSHFVGKGITDASRGVCDLQPTSGRASVDSSLDQLRLQVKYLLFDLEATRRENRYLRQMLESRHKRDFDDMKGDDSDPP